MFDFFRNSLRNKLLVSFLIIGSVPFLVLLGYTISFSQKRIIQKSIDEQHHMVRTVSKLINNHLEGLRKEVAFISSLDVMDDIIVDDLDKRISRLLEKKAHDYKSGVSMFVVNKKHRIIAASDKELIGKRFYKNSSRKDFFIQEHFIYFVSDVHATFDKKSYLGLFVLKYDIKNLDTYLVHKKEQKSYLYDPKNGITIGDRALKDLKPSASSGSLITYRYLIVYERFANYLDGWYIVYMVDKEKALALLYDFIRFMSYLALIILPFIIYIAFRISKSIVKPVEELTSFADEVTHTQDYSKTIQVRSKDEISILSDSFNEMLRTTKDALQRLKEENRLRLKRFTQLIEIFNTIIQTQSEEECIEVSLEEIKKLTECEELHFYRQRPNNVAHEFVTLYVNDFEKGVKEYYGYIELGVERFEDEIEKEFYNSIASMIALQIEKIRLIDKTTAASRAKSAFISNMSHELRTPLNAIIGFSQFMLSYEELSEDQQDTIANIESSAHYLLGMINDILDIAKIEAGKMEPNLEFVDLKEVLRSACEMLKPLADDKELEFEMIENDRLRSNIYKTDAKMFKQIVINLLSNAIKFTKEGRITVEMSENDNWLEVRITDTGIGLKPEDVEMLFGEFTQVENIMQKQHKGTGLGLSISKKMAQILGGDIELYSEGLGKGVTSVLKLPVITI